ncbi:MAG TPA: NAD(P)/FAD-dependent oxidoreductase [Gaiellales bacterium]|nr:NAD(P)/FAD-dependent oxidoreductase [Gaiellales bacterium]
MASTPAAAVVVGAGLAGLAAAGELRRAGVRTVVVEARDRVGGRVWSRTLEGGAVVEMGAEFVLPGGLLLPETAAACGLRLYEKGTTYGDREPRGGRPVTPALLAEAHATVASAAASGELGRANAADTLARLVVDRAAREVLLARVEVSGAASAHDQDDRCLCDSGKAFGPYPTHSVAGGNQRLAEALARPLGGDLHLRAAATGIVDSPGGGVRVAVAGGELEADVCVVAVPASVLGRIAFDPPLPEPVTAAFGRVLYGQAAKLFLPVDGDPPPSATLAVPERFWTFTQRDPDGRPLPVAGSFAGGVEALDRLEVTAGPAVWIDRVAALRPDLRLRTEEAVLSTWAGDLWVGGAYSVRTPDGALDDPLLRRRVGSIAFAGEHTAGEWHGLMEGALRSGLRAARQLLRSGAERR